jgi:hypothetical protein
MDFELVYKVEAVVGRASSSCCGAKLGLPEWVCCECGNVCERVLSFEDVVV